MKTKKIRLRRLTWDEHIYSCFMEFVLDNSEQIKSRGEIHFKGGTTYSWRHTVNRNPSVVSQEVWELILLRHLGKHYN